MFNEDFKKFLEQYLDKDYKETKDPYYKIDPDIQDHMSDLLKQYKIDQKREEKRLTELEKDYAKALEIETMYDELIDLLNEIQD